MTSPFENFKKADWIFFGCGLAILIVLLCATLGVNKYFSKSPVLEEKPIVFTVFFRGVTVTDDQSPFKIDENAFITIRNVPYTKLKITDVKFGRRQVLLETDKKGEYKMVDDVSVPSLYDFEVTLTDKAKITEDGAVVGGNKVKMGIPVILEGKNYKFNGVVSNVQILEENTENTENN
ncbi:MAG: DUF4330 domain-containing protein [Candidatus Gastranaerophilales bacterium]|nr:DUF4330 domain-containing protein [Candidatus Gastranaerophilales bacterium]